MMDFSAGAGVSTGGGDPIPNGALLWVIVNVRAVKPTQKGGAYIDIELTVDDGQPYARRKIWTKVGDPMNMGNSENYRQMGMVAVSRMLEAGRGAGPNNPGAYHINQYTDLSGLRVPIKVKVEPGQNGYDDKNDVAEWLTPNPQSGCAKLYQRLTSGDHGVGQKPAAQPVSGFGGFGSQQQTTQPQAQPSFGQPQPQGAPASTAANGWGSAMSTVQTAVSPSEVSYNQTAGVEQRQNNQPSWLAQANGG